MPDGAERKLAYKSRPKDRADRIVDEAARLFSERGYEGVSIEDIGEAVGITGPAVYRHFESKEALLGAVTKRLVEQFNDSYAGAIADGADAEEQIRGLLDRTIGPQIEQRNFWMLAATELRNAPRDAVRAIARRRNDAVALWVKPLRAVHPKLSDEEAELLVEIGSCLTPSLSYYQPQLSRPRLAKLLTAMLADGYLLPIDLDERWAKGIVESVPSTEGVSPLRTSARERILGHAIPLFRERGFAGVGIDEIGAASGVTGPAVYRHFRNKQDVLVAAASRASEQLSLAVSRALVGRAEPSDALDALIAEHLRLMAESPDLMAVYWTQKHALSDEQRDSILRRERSSIDDWVGVLGRVRPDLTEPEARSMVYGAIGMMNAHWRTGTDLRPERTLTLLRSVVRSSLRGSSTA
jgi:AcrR family transcriptional regulator